MSLVMKHTEVVPWTYLSLSFQLQFTGSYDTFLLPSPLREYLKVERAEKDSEMPNSTSSNEGPEPDGRMFPVVTMTSLHLVDTMGSPL